MYIGICEDEKVQLEYLVRQIKKYLEAIGEPSEKCRIEAFESAEELLFKYEQALPFDCLFLDIKMGKMDGMALAMDIRKRDKQIPIIFVTGDKDAVFDGYKVGAVRYLLKPISQEAVAEALECVKAEHLGEATGAKPQKSDYFCFNYAGEYVKVDKSAIYTVEVQGHYITARTLSDNKVIKGGYSEKECDQMRYKEYTFKETMKGIKEQLHDERFVQASRSVLVNLEHVESITRTECLLSGGEKVALSRSCYNEFNQAFIHFYE